MKILISTKLFLLISICSFGQTADTINYNYKIYKFETLIKYYDSGKFTNFDNGLCNLEISFNLKGKEIEIMDERGVVLDFYQIMDGETKTEKYSSINTLTTYQCIGMDKRLVVISLSRDETLPTKDAEIFISFRTLLHSIVYHFSLKDLKY